MCTFLSAKDQVSHPYKTTGKIMVQRLYGKLKKPQIPKDSRSPDQDSNPGSLK